MLIIDALRRADTAKEVCYLLTSYVETLQFYDAARQWPAVVTDLPVRCPGEIIRRLASLRATLERESLCEYGTARGEILQEAIDLFSTALDRLNTLDDAGGAQFSFDRRVIARHSPNLNV